MENHRLESIQPWRLINDYTSFFPIPLLSPFPIPFVPLSPFKFLHGHSFWVSLPSISLNTRHLVHQRTNEQNFTRDRIKIGRINSRIRCCPTCLPPLLPPPWQSVYTRGGSVLSGSNYTDPLPSRAALSTLPSRRGSSRMDIENSTRPRV